MVNKHSDKITTFNKIFIKIAQMRNFERTISLYKSSEGSI